MRYTFILAFVFLCPRFSTAALDIAGIEQAIGGKGKWNEHEKVYKITFPRDDVSVTVDGTTLPPFMGLTTWAAFQTGKEKPAIVMGDIVLFPDEVAAAISAALENGLDVTALHNHFFYDDPKVYFMHIGGEGVARDLAAGVRKLLDAVTQVRSAAPEPARTFAAGALPATSQINPQPLDDIFAATGQTHDGMYKIVVGREVTMPCGCKVAKEMGVNTWAAFYGDDERAIVDGDFACTFSELQSVLKSLRRSGINIVAIHNHMDAEAPRLIFLHYWGIGRPTDLATALKAAMDAHKSPASGAHEHHH